MKCHLVLFAIVLATRIAFNNGSSMCNFCQLREFSSRSSCYRGIHGLLSTFLAAHQTINETIAQLYCTQECAGNFMDFLCNQWDCQKGFKELYPRILASLCSRNENGQRCIHMLRPSPTDNWNDSNPSSLCSPEHHSHLQGLLDKYGCCFELTFGARIKSDPQRFCNVQSPPVCTLDYSLPAIAGLIPKDRTSNTDRLPDGFSSDTRTSLSYSSLLLTSILCLFAVVP